MTSGDDDDDDEQQQQQQQRLECSAGGRLHGHTCGHIHVHSSDSGKTIENNNNNNITEEEEKNHRGKCGNGHTASSYSQPLQQLQQHAIHHHSPYHPTPSSSTTTTKTTAPSALPKEFHIAPMMGDTTREMRQLVRILSKKCVLWTEMIVANTILHTQHLDQILDYDRDVEHPIVCQLGGCHAEQLQDATQIALTYHYDEINLNCGCPSDRVTGKQEFGAVLMKELELAESAVHAMVEAAATTATASSIAATDDSTTTKSTPISIKCRVGVDDRDTLEDLIEFIDRMSQQHCRIFYLHARKAILGGLMTPHENRTIPPLNYPRVYDICRRFPHCTFYINGGIQTLQAAKDLCYGVVGDDDSNSNNGTTTQQHTTVPCAACQFENGSCIAPPPYPVPSNLRGCMVGRVAMNNPTILWDVDRFFYGLKTNPCATRKDVLDRYCTYLQRVYPRRCCDRDPFVTTDLTDQHDFVMEYDYCPLCVDLYYHDDCDEREKDVDGMTSSIRVAPKANYQDDNGGIRIKTCTVSRCVKPIQNLFYGVRYARVFSREIERQVRNVEVRNCGPAAMIQRALRVMPDEIINRPLDPAEEKE